MFFDIQYGKFYVVIKKNVLHFVVIRVACYRNKKTHWISCV